VLDDEIRRLISTRATASDIKDAALRNGTHTLRDDGIEKILAGATTIAEVERVTLEPEFTEPVEEPSALLE
jgi:type II secretory ATPase GspE/PulE/Tfp pilus assembly ATPase PilB-like protein